MREFFVKAGALQPTAKGVALPPEAWAALAGGVGALSTGLDARDKGVALELGGNKRASISDYGGALRGARACARGLVCWGMWASERGWGRRAAV